MMRKSIAILAASAVTGLIALGCGGEARRGDETARARPLTIKGSDTMVILGQRIAEEYMKDHPGTVVQVNGGGSGTGIAALINGTVDLAQSSRAMKPDEMESVRKSRNAAVVERAVALDALSVFVHESNPLESMSVDQLKQIFQGKITNWSAVGGPNEQIILYGRENSSGTYDYFREHVLSGEDFSPRVQTLAGTAAVINAVARDAKGIGYGGIAYAADVRAVAIAGEGGQAVAPSEETVEDGTYPLARKLYYYHLEGAPERVTDFVDYSLTPEAQQLIAAVGYFPLPASMRGEAASTQAVTETTPPDANP